MEDLRNKRSKTNTKIAKELLIVNYTLNVNGLNSPIKRQRLAAECIKTHDSTIYCLQYNLDSDVYMYSIYIYTYIYVYNIYVFKCIYI